MEEEEMYNDLEDENYYNDDDDFEWFHRIEATRDNEVVFSRGERFRCREVMAGTYRMYRNRYPKKTDTICIDVRLPLSFQRRDAHVFEVLRSRYPSIDVSVEHNRYEVEYRLRGTFATLLQMFNFNWWAIMFMRGGFDPIRQELWAHTNLFTNYIGWYASRDCYLYVWYNPDVEDEFDSIDSSGIVSAVHSRNCAPISVRRAHGSEAYFYSPLMAAEFCATDFNITSETAWYVYHRDLDAAHDVARILKTRYPNMPVWVSNSQPYTGKRIGFRTADPFFPILWTSALLNAKFSGAESVEYGFNGILREEYIPELMKIWESPQMENVRVRTAHDFYTILKGEIPC